MCWCIALFVAVVAMQPWLLLLLMKIQAVPKHVKALSSNVN